MFVVDGTVPSVVLDMGTHTSKAGCAGEDLPHVLFPAASGYIGADDGTELSPSSAQKNYRCGTSAMFMRKDNVEVSTAFDLNGIVENWDMLEAQLDHALKRELQVDPSEHGMLVTEPTHNGRTEREKMCELMMEKYDAPAVYMAKAPVLGAYANGRTTGLIVDVGHCGTSVVPVFEGAVVKNRHLRTPVGGAQLTKYTMNLLSAQNLPLRPIYSFSKRYKKDSSRVNEQSDEEEGAVAAKDRTEFELEHHTFPKTAASYHEFRRVSLAEEVKEAISRVNEVVHEPIDVPNSEYELPDGNMVQFGVEKFAAPELLFGKLPHCAANPAMDRKPSPAVADTFANLGTSGGLSGLIQDTVSRCESSQHRELLASICLTGGSSVIPGLFERLHSELQFKFGRPPKVVAAAGNPERRYCAWTGGSILATFSEFQKMWISKEDYDENGASFVHKKCL